mgnify:CR=1 FL=1
MQIYLDTANVKEIQEGANLGLIDGVTTNPSLVAKEGRSFKEMLLEICKMVDGPISAEVVGVDQRRARSGQGSQEYRGEGSPYPGRSSGHKEARGRGDSCECHLVLLPDAGVAGREGGRVVCLAIHWSSRRREFGWNGTDSADCYDL